MSAGVSDLFSSVPRDSQTVSAMSVEIQDFVEAVQFCTDRCNGDELKRLLSLRYNATLSNAAAVSVALKVRACGAYPL